MFQQGLWSVLRALTHTRFNLGASLLACLCEMFTSRSERGDCAVCDVVNLLWQSVSPRSWFIREYACASRSVGRRTSMPVGG